MNILSSLRSYVCPQGAAVLCCCLTLLNLLQYQAASTVFEFSEGWERAYVSEDTGLVMIEGAGFAQTRSYTCQFFDRPNLEVRLHSLFNTQTPFLPKRTNTP